MMISWEIQMQFSTALLTERHIQCKGWIMSSGAVNAVNRAINSRERQPTPSIEPAGANLTARNDTDLSGILSQSFPPSISQKSRSLTNIKSICKGKKLSKLLNVLWSFHFIDKFQWRYKVRQSADASFLIEGLRSSGKISEISIAEVAQSIWWRLLMVSGGKVQVTFRLKLILSGLSRMHSIIQCICLGTT